MFNQFNQFSPITQNSVVGTWQAVNRGFNGQTELAVVQFKPDGTFVEGFDLANHASTYTGRYSFDTPSQRISFIIDSAAGDGPQPVPFHQQALSSRVINGMVGLNNDLTFTFQNTSVAPSDFVLPPAPTTFTSFRTFNDGFTNHSSFSPGLPSNTNPLFAVHSPFF